MKKEIAFFDFDGTITTKDTLLEFIKFSKGNFRFFVGFLLHIHYLIAYKLHVISNQKAKEKILKFFFGGTDVEVFNSYCIEFSNKILPKLFRPQALKEIERLQNQNVIIVIVSASPENWIANWATATSVSLISSKLEIINEKITGKILGKNCHGNEKDSRIYKTYNLAEYSVVAAYGDTPGDKPMLNLAKQAYYKPFV